MAESKPQPAAQGNDNAQRKPLDKKKAIGAVLGVVIGTVVYFACDNVGLSQQGVICLAVLAWAIVWWIAKVLPDFATALLMAAAFMLVGGMSATTVFSSFSGSTWWLLIAAFSLGAAMKSTGLMHRMALAIIQKLPQSFTARVAGLIAVGTVVGPFVPSMAAKTSMLAPIAMNMGEAAGYKPQDKQMTGLFAAMFTGVRTVAPAVISASVIGYALLGLLPQDTQTQFDMLHWFVAALPWFVVVMVLNFAAIVLLYKPRGGAAAEARTQGESRASLQGGKRQAAAAPDERKPMSLREKELLVIIVATVALWATQSLHGISATTVALVALVAMLACGIMTPASFKNDVSWSSLVFIGIVIGLASVFQEAGISEWIVSVAGPVFQRLAGNPFAFVLGVGVVTLVLRFLIVSQIAYLNIVMAFVVPLALAQGISPWVAGFVMYAMIDPWFVLYQNPCYLAAYYSVDGQMARQSEMAKYCLVYSAISLVGLAASVPYWQMMGLFG